MLQHVDPRILYMRLSSGLGNRLGPLLSATRLLELQYFDRLIITWTNLNCSQFQITDLFEICSDRIQVQSDLEPPTQWVQNSCYELRLTTLVPWRYYTHSAYAGYAPIVVEQDRKLSNDEIIQQIHEFYPNYLRIRPELAQIADEFPITNEYIGIHCRRTDVDLNEMLHFNPANYQKVLPKLARIRDDIFATKLSELLDPTDKLFVASDDETTKEYYSSKLANVRTRKSKLPVNMWNIHPNHQKFGQWGQTLRTKEDIVDAFIELLILTRCSAIITDHVSTFAAVAQFLRRSKVYYLRSSVPILMRSSLRSRS